MSQYPERRKTGIKKMCNMKRTIILLSTLLCAFCLSSFTAQSNDATVSSFIVQDYCPEGYVCEATNCTAVCSSANPQELTGISVYKNSNGDVIAYVPGHGRLRCYKQNGCWYFRANSHEYRILGLKF